VSLISHAKKQHLKEILALGHPVEDQMGSKVSETNFRKRMWDDTYLEHLEIT
jgi:hypothetical protein